jgi:CO dehydrogenase/acetyl-CoA synthase delta subunit
MAELEKMPPVEIDQNELKKWGLRWLKNINDENGQSKAEFSFDRQQSVNFALFIDLAFGTAISRMLGNIRIEVPSGNSLLPNAPDIVEVGPVRIVGGIRPQNFDAAYRPDGPRIVFDSKTLNEEKSIGKNWQNMINDLGTEATTIHTRFPYSLVVFFVVLPKPALNNKQKRDLIRTLERLGTRKSVLDQPHLAEAISMVVWEPETGKIDKNIPEQTSHLRLEKIHSIIEEIYLDRYKGLPPHD